MTTENIHPDTLLISCGRPHNPGQPLNIPPIFASNYVYGTGPYGSTLGYGRDGSNESLAAFEELVEKLEGGGSCTSFSSGMAAISSIFHLLKVKSKVAIPTNCYGGVVALVDEGKEKYEWEVKRIEAGETSSWVEVIENGYDLVWLEGVTNPMLDVMDIETISKTPRKPTTILAIDGTFSTPLNIRPLEKGADISVHSATKFLGGHSDLIAGVVTTKNKELDDKIRRYRQIHGAVPGAMEAFLAIRGSRTLAMRLEKAQENALILAKRLENHPKVLKVRYPGLPSHPQYEIAKKLFDRGFGTMISFDVKNGADGGDIMCQSTNLIINATSLGGVESTMERRGKVPGQGHLPPSLLRLSVGCEHIEDLWRDLEKGLEKLE